MLKINNVSGLVVLFVLYIDSGNCYPQGFFPKLATWNKSEGSLTLLPNVKVESPIKSSFVNVFGRKKIIENKPNNEATTANIRKPSISEEILSKPHPPTSFNTEKEDNRYPETIYIRRLQKQEEVSEKSKNISEYYVTDNQIDETYSTTETATEDYETTTIEYELLNRSSPQLVASLLG